jgi:hypothetical protein
MRSFIIFCCLIQQALLSPSSAALLLVRAFVVTPTTTSSFKSNQYRRTRLKTKYQNEETNTDPDKRSEDYNINSPSPPSISFFPFGLTAVAFVAFWPLVAFLRANSDISLADFDIDMFMALKGILDGNDPSGVYSEDQILELPPLSPAEQLVGAIFGPP